MDVFGGRGENLQDRFAFMPVTPEAADYYLRNKMELRKAIEEHDAVSFDLFDTLIMRKTLEPGDIFDIVEERLKEKGIVILQLKKKRQAAEYRTLNGNIYQIYETLGKMLGLDRTVTETVLREEIQCEKDIEPPLIPSFYLLISRRLAFRAATQTERDITGMKNYLHVSVGAKANREEALKNVFRDIFGDQALTNSEEQHGLNHDFIIEEAQKTRKKYLAYRLEESINVFFGAGKWM